MSATYLEPAPLTLPFAPGDVIADKYEVVGVLGSGGVAYVISALHLELGEMVALKFLRPESLAHEDVVARFASEARAVARIKSEHVAHVLDVGALPDGAPFIVMEYLEGKDLADVLAERRKLPIKVAVDYVLQACEALACAHAVGIVHRDIKPENLFLTQQAASVECIKVLDFGISKSAMAAHDAAGGRKSAKTMLPMGTPGYMSPEQIRACSTVDARTDIWALGCVLSELISGASTFQAPTQVQLGAVILETDPVPLRKLAPEAPAELEAVVARCLQKKAEDRFQDVADLAAALYVFGPRRGRVSAERCHQVLKGHRGVAVEFNSVPPPSFDGDTPLPASSTAAVVSGVPSGAPLLDPRSTSTPATLNVVEYPEPRRRGRGLVAAAVVALGAALGIGFAIRSHAPTQGAAAAAVTSPVVAAALPTATATVVKTAAAALPAPTAPAAAPDSSADDTADASAVAATAAGPSAAKTAAYRAKLAREKRVAVAREAAAAKAKPAISAKRTAALDDNEPDVGY